VRNPCLAAVLTELERAGATALAGKEAEVTLIFESFHPPSWSRY
jgi:hypothetical protein